MPIKKATNKVKSLSRFTKFNILVFSLLFAGIGSYLITNSSAGPPTGYGVASVQVVEMNLQGNLTGNNIPWAVINIHPTPAEASYVCTQGSNPAGQGSSGSSGIGAFTCGSWSGGRAYYADAIRTGYVSRGSYTATVNVGQTTVFRVVLQLKDTDGDGVADNNDSCPTQGNAGYGVGANGCPNPAPTGPSVSFPTDLTVRYNPIDYGSSTSMYWHAINGTACSLERASVTNGAVGTFGNGISTPIGVQERNPGTLNATTAFRVYCSGINGGSAGYSSTRIVTVNPQPGQPQPPGGGGGGGGGGSVSCPAGTTGTPPNCIKTITSTNTRVVTRTVTAPPVNSSDKERPTVPENLMAEQAGNGEVTLSWDASTDNIGVVGYTVERSSDGTNWEMLDEAVVDTTYADNTAEFGTQYSYRVSAQDAAGNFSDYAVTDLLTNEFTPNVYPDQDSSITSEDGIVTVNIPVGALSEEAYCEILKDTVSAKAPKGYKLAAGAYTIDCKNKDGDGIIEFEKAATVVMDMKDFKQYKKFAVFSIDGSNLTNLNAAYDSNDKTLTFKMTEFATFAAYGAKGGSLWWLWLLILLLIGGLIFFIIRLRNSGNSDDSYYDTTSYVTMPPTQTVGPGGPEQHTSLPDMVAQGQQPQAGYPQDPYAQPPQYPGQQPPAGPGQGQQPPQYPS